jgi:hypothetical protein
MSLNNSDHEIAVPRFVKGETKDEREILSERMIENVEGEERDL